MNKVAIVTGGRRGIGFGIAHALMAEGTRVVITGTRPAEEAQDAVRALQASGGDVLYCAANVADAAARAELVARTRDHFGPPNILVNNAGIAPRERADLLEATEASFEEVMRVNLQGPYFLTQAVARTMIAARRQDAGFDACICNVSSISATVASTNRGEYCLSKAGIAMATRLWAARLGEFGIPVYEIRPGIVRTDMTAGVQAKYDRLIEEGLLVEKRWGLPGDIGKAVAALARGDLPYATGQVLVLDGGLTLPRL